VTIRHQCRFTSLPDLQGQRLRRWRRGWFPLCEPHGTKYRTVRYRFSRHVPYSQPFTFVVLKYKGERTGNRLVTLTYYFMFLSNSNPNRSRHVECGSLATAFTIAARATTAKAGARPPHSKHPKPTDRSASKGGPYGGTTLHCSGQEAAAQGHCVVVFRGSGHYSARRVEARSWV